MPIDYDKILWNKIAKGSASECWYWQGAVNKRGHGCLSVSNKFSHAHRVVWELTRNQKLPPCSWIKRTCGNNDCCNPRHMRVMAHRGSGHPSSKINEGEAREIYNLYMAGQSQSQLADKFGIGRKTVGKIANGETWRHVNFRDEETKKPPG